MHEVFNKTLKVGDLVLYIIGKGDMSIANIGIVISKSTVFIKDSVLSKYKLNVFDDNDIYKTKSPKYVYLIDNPDEYELYIKNDLINHFNERMYYDK